MFYWRHINFIFVCIDRVWHIWMFLPLSLYSSVIYFFLILCFFVYLVLLYIFNCVEIRIRCEWMWFQQIGRPLSSSRSPHRVSSNVCIMLVLCSRVRLACCTANSKAVCGDRNTRMLERQTNRWNTVHLGGSQAIQISTNTIREYCSNSNKSGWGLFSPLLCSAKYLPFACYGSSFFYI